MRVTATSDRHRQSTVVGRGLPKIFGFVGSLSGCTHRDPFRHLPNRHHTPQRDEKFSR